MCTFEKESCVSFFFKRHSFSHFNDDLLSEINRRYYCLLCGEGKSMKKINGIY